MKFKIILTSLILIFSSLVFANDIHANLSIEEQNTGNSVIAKFNEFIKNPNMRTIEEAILVKNKFLKMVEDKRDNLAVKGALETLNQLPVYKHFCVGAVLAKDSKKINQCVKNLDLMDREFDNKYASTKKEIIYENLVVYFGNNLDYKKAEKIAYRMLSMYPNSVETLKNLSILYAKDTSRFNSEKEAACFAFYFENRYKKLKGIKTTDFEECKGFDGDAKFNEISKIVLRGE